MGSAEPIEPMLTAPLQYKCCVLLGAAGIGAAASSSSSQASFGADTGFDGQPPPKKKKSKSTEQVLDVVSGGGLLGDSSLLAGMSGDLLSADLRDQDWNFDPNEPRYCICNQVSYGDMVACDNEDVRLFF